MPITPLITKAESDTYNALSASWLLLPDAEKDIHIFNASVHMQNSWSCSDVVWTDPTTLDDDLKKACAYFADASRLGVLFSEVSPTEKHRAIIEETKKLDGMLKTTKWASAGSFTSGNPLESIDAIMKLYCTRLNNITLLRV